MELYQSNEESFPLRIMDCPFWWKSLAAAKEWKTPAGYRRITDAP